MFRTSLPPSSMTHTLIKVNSTENTHTKGIIGIDLPFTRRMESLRSTLQGDPQKAKEITDLLIKKYKLHNTLLHNDAKTLFTECALTAVNCVLPDDLEPILSLLKSGWSTEAAMYTKARFEEDFECMFKGVLLADGRQNFANFFLHQHKALSGDTDNASKALKQFENEIGSGKGFGYKTFNLTNPDSLVELTANRKNGRPIKSELIVETLFCIMTDSDIIHQILSSPYITKTVTEKQLTALTIALRSHANQIPTPCQTALLLIQLATEDGVFSCQKSITQLYLLRTLTRMCRGIQQFVTAHSDLEITSVAIGDEDMARAEAEISQEEARFNSDIHSEAGKQRSAEFAIKYGFQPTKVNMLLQIPEYQEKLGMLPAWHCEAGNIPA